MTSRTKTAVAAFGLLFAARIAQAHYLWIEPGETGTMIFYGEADALLKEKSPGRLDRIKAPKAFAVPAGESQASVAALSRMAGHIAIASPAGATDILAAEESLEVRDLSANGLGRAKTNYYARHGQPTSGAAPLALDVRVRGPNALTVLYLGQPLAHAKLQVIAPNTWVQEHKTDVQGHVSINTPWRGLYVLHILHVDKTPGEFAGQPYDNLRQHFTYSFIQGKGPDAGPPIPPQQGMD